MIYRALTVTEESKISMQLKKRGYNNWEERYKTVIT